MNDVLFVFAKLRKELYTAVLSDTLDALEALVAEGVAFLRDGRVVATGTHAELLDREPEYRRVVTRESESDLAVTEVAPR